MEYQQKNKEAYGKAVEKFRKRNETSMDFSLIDIFLHKLEKGSKILDAGCGFGRDAKYIKEKGYEVIGVDFSEDMVNEARNFVSDIPFKVMDVTDMKFENESFDAVICNALLLTFKKADVQNVLQELKRVLKPGGIIFVSVKKGEGEGFEYAKHYNVTKFASYFEVDEIKRIMNINGFSILEVLESKSPYNIQWINVYAKREV